MNSKKRRVAVVIDLEWPLAHHQQTFAGIYRYAARCGNWSCTIAPYLAPASIDEGSLDGVIGRITPTIANWARKTGVPLVNLWMNTPARGVFSVLPDAAESGRMAARHLLARGFRQFGFLGITNDRFSEMQLTGIREQLEPSGYGCSVCWTPRLHPDDKKSWQQFQSQLSSWIEGWSTPIAVVSTTDLLARYIAEAAEQRGLHVPTDVALVGSANEVAICSTPEPSLSSIDYGYERIGYRAAEALDQLMSEQACAAGASHQKNGKRADVRRDTIYMIPQQLVIRQSSGAFAVEQPLVIEALTYIGENLHETLTLDHLAEQTATTPRTLSRLFQKSLGKTVHQAVTQLRLERVKRELVESDELLKIIARRCGFRDAIHLCKVFQREEHITPSQYRNRR